MKLATEVTGKATDQPIANLSPVLSLLPPSLPIEEISKNAVNAKTQELIQRIKIHIDKLEFAQLNLIYEEYYECKDFLENNKNPLITAWVRYGMAECYRLLPNFGHDDKYIALAYYKYVLEEKIIPVELKAKAIFGKANLFHYHLVHDHDCKHAGHKVALRCYKKFLQLDTQELSVELTASALLGRAEIFRCGKTKLRNPKRALKYYGRVLSLDQKLLSDSFVAQALFGKAQCLRILGKTEPDCLNSAIQIYDELLAKSNLAIDLRQQVFDNRAKCDKWRSKKVTFAMSHLDQPLQIEQRKHKARESLDSRKNKPKKSSKEINDDLLNRLSDAKKNNLQLSKQLAGMSKENKKQKVYNVLLQAQIKYLIQQNVKLTADLKAATCRLTEMEENMASPQVQQKSRKQQFELLKVLRTQQPLTSLTEQLPDAIILTQPATGQLANEGEMGNSSSASLRQKSGL